MSEPITVLFLCTRNAARSLLAEAILRAEGGDRFRALSAGSAPVAAPHPAAMALLTRLGHPTEGLRTKGWEVFSGPGAPVLDFVFTLCDQTADEVCPVWPGQPISALWSIPDPLAVPEDQIGIALGDAYRMLKTRLSIFASLPLASLDATSLRRRVAEIGAEETA